MLDEDLEMEEVDEDGGRPYKDVRQSGGVDLTEVAGQEAVLRAVSGVPGRVCTEKGLTFAISSVFLNSPSVMVVSPRSSTSVHRTRGSSAALADMVRRGAKMSSSRPGRSFGCSGLLPRRAAKPHSLSCHVSGRSSWPLFPL